MRLKELRKERKMLQRQVAEAINCSQAVYSRYENGEREPSKEILAALADFYSVSVDYLLGREDRIQSEAESIVEHYTNAQGGRPAGALAFSPNPINAARENIRKDADQFSPETMSVIEGILNKLAKLDEEDRKIAEDHIDFLIERKRKGDA